MEPAKHSVMLVTEARFTRSHNRRNEFGSIAISWSAAIGNADKYRANAVHCFRMANRALTPHDEQNWLNMAETWLGMIPERQRTPNEFFQGTGQELSKSLL